MRRTGSWGQTPERRSWGQTQGKRRSRRSLSLHSFYPPSPTTRSLFHRQKLRPPCSIVAFVPATSRICV
jgi:hypothetical protein